VGSAGSSQEKVLTIYLYSTEFYAANGLTMRGLLIFDSGGMTYQTSVPADWLVDAPTVDDVLFAQSQWGAIVASEVRPLDKARRLAEALLDDLGLRQGVPSSAMQAPPFDQYQRAMSGADFVDSSNLAQIFTRAATSLGLPTRVVQMGTVLSRGNDYDLFGSDLRSAVEVFDVESNTWAWFDLASGVVGADLAGYRFLNAAEMLRAASDPLQLAAVTAWTYDPATRTEAPVAFANAATAQPLLSYLRSAPMLRYAHRNP
jgi:hypothetical protein